MLIESLQNNEVEYQGSLFQLHPIACAKLAKDVLWSAVNPNNPNIDRMFANSKLLKHTCDIYELDITRVQKAILNK